MKKRILLILFLFAVAVGLQAQKIEITKLFTEVSNSSVIAMYSSEFASEIKEYGDEETGDFKFVVIRMNLEGDVAEAKKRVTLRCPTQNLVRTYKETSNEMLFLFPYEAKTIFVDCGDGCERKPLISGKQLRSNTVYEITVKYIAKKQNAYTYYEPEIENQWLMFNVEPKSAIVRVNGEIWQTEDGIAAKRVALGTYEYSVTAKEYHDKGGKVEVGTEKKTINVTLLPAYGWISVESNTIAKGADVYLDNTHIGQIPISKYKVGSGTHKIEIVQKKYKTFVTQIKVTDNATVPIVPTMQADFAKITFKVANNAEIWINNTKIGIGTQVYDVPSGSCFIETKLKGHKSMSKSITVQPSMSGQTVELPAPLPIYGIMDIDVRPMNATVYIDGRSVGETPITLSKVLIGEHQVKITKAGYADKNETVVIKENATYALTGTMTKQEQSVNNSNNATIQSSVVQPTTGMTVTDCQGHTYPVVKIGSQYWMAENLQCTKYDTQSERAGQTLQTSSKFTYAPYYKDRRYATTNYSGNLTQEQRKHLGLLYNWAAAMGYTGLRAKHQKGDYNGRRQGICPNGWHLPNRADWEMLANALGGVPKADGLGIQYSNVGAKLKSRSGWCNGCNGTDDYGFSGLPAPGHFDVVFFLTSDACSYSHAYCFKLSYDVSYLYQETFDKLYFFPCSVRCLKN